MVTPMLLSLIKLIVGTDKLFMNSYIHIIAIT